MNYCVVTTINKPTKAIEKLHDLFGNKLIVVGDKKTPEDWNYKDTNYMPYVKREPWFEGCDPTNHYARKNLGYLEAMRNNAALIYDTDDDNIPNDNWKVRSLICSADVSETKGWVNVYDFFSDEYVWPRGFALSKLSNKGHYNERRNVRSAIQQGLSNGDADVDAVWRLILNKNISFENRQSIFLDRGSWCPFNSQTTWWLPKAYPLMYLPLYASFRMTDIWRSFIAQRCLWELGEGITFHSPAEVFQDRNQHNLLKDFQDEIPGYLHNEEIVETLESLSLKKGEENICDNLLACYEAIVDKDILPYIEIRCLKCWIKEYEKATGNLE